MGQNGLFDMLGIIIGFSGVMLTLSMLVTALVQAISSWLNLRGTNLRVGIQELLDTAQQENTDVLIARRERDLECKSEAAAACDDVLKSLIKLGAPADVISKAQEEWVTAKKAAVLAKREVARLKKGSAKTPLSDEELEEKKGLSEELLKNNRLLAHHHGGGGKVMDFLFPKPQTTWLTKEELRALLLGSNRFDDAYIESAMEWFSRMELVLSQRFLANIRLVTFLCAVVVAFLLQVSTPELLSRLSRDPEFRASAVAAAESVAERMPEWQGALASFRDISPDALGELAEKHPEAAELIEEASGEGATLEHMLAELRAILVGSPYADVVMADYREILLRRYKEANSVAIDVFREGLGELSAIDIAVWSRGMEYYFDLGNVLGVAITAILISLGAPFWFKVLQTAANLRDTLRSPTEREKKNGEKADAAA